MAFRKDKKMKKPKKVSKTVSGKKSKVSRKQGLLSATPGHKGRFDQLLDDAVLGVERKKQ